MRGQLRCFRSCHNLVQVILTMICCCLTAHALAQSSQSMADNFPIIPTPKQIKYGSQEVCFTSFYMAEDDFAIETSSWERFLLQEGRPQNADGLKFRFIYDSDSNLGKEGYSLCIDSVVTLSAESPKGIYYGIQSLKQLYRSKEDGGVLPQVQIADWPSFKIRGFMHDTGRNFQSVAQLKEQIEVLAMYKFNVFHWHLTDNPGWRLESKIYPELQSKEAFSRDVGQYYTHEDFKNLLAFCKERHITVIPEFDIPGHTAAFRRAFEIGNMNDPKVLPILRDLFEELMRLGNASEMPFIHIGTDEVREQNEAVAPEIIQSIMEQIRNNGREVLVWKEGIQIEADTTSIQQLWAMHPPSEGRRFIDSRANYINHLDPLAGMVRLFFQQPGRQAEGDSLALGGILCAWPDNNVTNERDILRQNPIYPAMVFYSDAIWNGRQVNHQEYWAKLPNEDAEELKKFREFETKVSLHRDKFFKGKEFPYLQNSHLPWLIIGPFDHDGDFSKSFPVEAEIKANYTVAGESYQWKGPYFGGTLHLNHFFGFPSITDHSQGTIYARTYIYSPDTREQDFWIGFHGWSRSGGRRGGPFPQKGQWHHTNPKIWVNGKEIEAPEWQQPGLGIATDEIPFIGEDYFYRNPSKIPLRQGWNSFLLKIPHGDPSWKWMFTCTPIRLTATGIKEAEGLHFSINPNSKG